jgi:hypothetical protein
MMTHYPRWITLPSFAAITFALIGWLSTGQYQDAAFALAMAFLMGLVLQTQANYWDQLALVHRDVHGILTREAKRWGLPLGLGDDDVEMGDGMEVHRVVVRPIVVPPGGQPPTIATTGLGQVVPISTPVPVVPVDTPERLADRLETAMNTQETMKLTDEMKELNQHNREGGVPRV